MDKLSYNSYGRKCVLGGEIVYLVCLLGGFLPLRLPTASALHHSLFEIFPGFTWITIGSVFIGAMYIFIFSWIFAGYYVWMHNSSMIRK